MDQKTRFLFLSEGYGGSDGEESTCNAADPASIPGSLLVLPQPYLAPVLAPWILEAGIKTEARLINGASLDQDPSRRFCHLSLQRSPEAFSDGSDTCTSYPKGQGASTFQAAQDGYPRDRRDKTAATGPQSPGLECSHTHWLLELSVLGTLHRGYPPSSLLPWLFPGGSDSKSVCLQCGRPGFDPWVRRIPCRRKWQPTPVLLPGKSHGWRSLVGCSPWGRTESDTTERLYFHFHGGSDGEESACSEGDLGSIPGLGRSPGKGKGYPLQYS